MLEHNAIHLALKIFSMIMFVYYAIIFETRDSAKAGIWAIIFAVTMGW